MLSIPSPAASMEVTGTATRLRHRSSAADRWDFMNARTCLMTSRVAGLSSATSKACGLVA